jgi:hypothetical protein
MSFFVPHLHDLTRVGGESGEFAIPDTTPPASATQALLRFGNPLVGGSASGTFWGANADSAWTGDFINLQRGGASAFRVDYTGNATFASISTASSLDVTGYIYNSTSNTVLVQDSLETRASNAGTIGLIVKLAASHTASAQEWQTSSGTAVASVSAAGDIIARSINASTANSVLGQVSVAGITVPSGSGVQWSGGWLTYETGGNYYIRDTTNGIMRATFNKAVGGGTALLGQTTLTSDSAASIPLAVYGAASQSGNLTSWLNNSSTLLARVTSNGSIDAPGFAARILGSSVGQVTLSAGDAGNTGYVSWLTNSGTRLGYLGYSPTHVPLNLENSASFQVLGGFTQLGTSTAYSARLSINSDDTSLGGIYMRGAATRMTWYATGGGTDEKQWDFYANGSSLTFRCVDDSFTTATNWLTVSRIGTSPTNITFPNGSVVVTNSVSVGNFLAVSDGGFRNVRTGINILDSGYSTYSTVATAFSASTTALIVRGAASQSANPFEVQNSSNTVLSRVSPAGDLYAVTATIASSTSVGSLTSGGSVVSGTAGTGGGQLLANTDGITTSLGYVLTVPEGAAGVARFSFNTPLRNQGYWEWAKTNSAATRQGKLGLYLCPGGSNTGTLAFEVSEGGEVNLPLETKINLVYSYAQRPMLFLGGGGASGGTNHFSGSASGTLFGINASSGYAGDLINVQVAGSTKFLLNTSGTIFLGNSTDYVSPVSSGVLQTNARWEMGKEAVVNRLQTASTSVVALRVRSSSGHTANLTDWENSSGTVIASVSKDGYFGSGVTPSAPFHAYGTTPEYWNQSSGGVTCKWTATSSAAIFGTSSNHSVYWRSNGTDRGLLVNDGRWVLGGTSIFTAQLSVGIQDASYAGLAVRAAASQSGNLIEAQNNAGTPLTYIKPSGHLFITCSYASTVDTGITLSGNITGMTWVGTSGGSRNFSAINNYSGGGVLDIIYGSSTGANPDTYILRLDAVKNSVGLGGAADASAQLYMSSTSQGFRPPVMTTTQRNAISSPAQGLMVYNSTNTRLETYDGGWNAVSTTNYWSQASGVLSPATSTDTLALGTSSPTTARYNAITASSIPGFVARCAASVTEDLFRGENSSGSTIARITSSGAGSFTGSVTASGSAATVTASASVGTAGTLLLSGSTSKVSWQNLGTEKWIAEVDGSNTWKLARVTGGGYANVMYSDFSGNVAFGDISTPKSTVDIYGCFGARITNNTIGGTLDDNASVQTVDAAGGSVTLTLPSAVTKIRRIYIIKRIDSSGNSVTINTTSSQTIDGASSYAGLSAQYKSVALQSDGSNWIILWTY